MKRSSGVGEDCLTPPGHGVGSAAIVALLLVASGLRAQPVNYDEAVNGDLEGNEAFILLDIGQNTFVGTEGGQDETLDFDDINFSIRDGQQLDSVTFEFLDVTTFPDSQTTVGRDNWLRLEDFTVISGASFATIDTTRYVTDALQGPGPYDLFAPALPLGPGNYRHQNGGLKVPGEWTYRIVMTVSAAGTVADDPEERAALEALFTATAGDGWINKENWMSGQSVCTWAGVSCFENRVVALNLSFNNLSGTLPPQLSALTQLGTLTLQSNQLTGQIPTSFGSLTALQILDISGNQLSGNLPSSLGNLTSLTQLYAWSNQLSGIPPASLQNLTSLTALWLAFNQFTGDLQFLSAFPSLTSLWLDGNNFSGSIPPQLGNLQLDVLGLSDNMLTGPIPPEFANLTNLFYLSLGGNQLTPSELPAWVGSNPNLSTLVLYGGSFFGEIPESWSALNNLSVVDLSRNALTGPIPAWLGQNTQLSFLNLSSNQFSGVLPEQLRSLTALFGLLLNDNQLSGPLPEWIGELASLSQLRLENNQFTGPIPNSIGQLSGLWELNLANNQLSGELPAELTSLSNLQTFSVAGNQFSGEIGEVLGTFLGRPELIFGLDLTGNQFSCPYPSALAVYFVNEGQECVEVIPAGLPIWLLIKVLNDEGASE